MRTTRRTLAALAAGIALAACGGTETCPTTAAAADSGQDMSSACTAPATQQVAISVHLCEACSHTSPSCAPDLSATGGGSGEIFLDTRWEICTDDSSCTLSTCSFVTCQFAIANGSYTVHTLAEAGGTQTFTLDVTGGAPACSGYL